MSIDRVYEEPGHGLRDILQRKRSKDPVSYKGLRREPLSVRYYSSSSNNSVYSFLIEHKGFDICIHGRKEGGIEKMRNYLENIAGELSKDGLTMIVQGSKPNLKIKVA